MSTGEQTHILFSRDIFRPRSRLFAEKTLMLNKPSSRLNINNNNTLLLLSIFEGKFKNKNSNDPFSDFVNHRIELIQTLISFNNFFSLKKTGKHHALYFTGPLTFVLLGGERKLYHHHEEKQKSFLD